MNQKYFSFHGSGKIVFVNDPCTDIWLWERLIPIFDSLGYDAVAFNPIDSESRARLEAVLAEDDVVAAVAQGAGGRYLAKLGERCAFLIAPSDETLSSENWLEGRAKAAGCAYADWQLIERRLNPNAEKQMPKWNDALRKRGYCICCTEDAVVPIAQQRNFAARHGLQNVCELRADHFPQFSRTYELSYLIHSALMDQAAR